MIPKISVITATRNRAHTLSRVFKSLNKQVFKKFEWIICDDGSDDKTIDLLKKFKKKANFKIRIFHFEKRAGKPRIDNFCIKQSLGEFIVFADSDDAFKKNSFTDFIKEWSKIPNKTKKKTFAIISRVVTEKGKPLESKFNIENKSISLIDLNNRTQRKEKWLFIKRNIINKYKFPEIDFYVPEGMTWEKISKKYNVWILDNCYRIFYSDTSNSVTFSKKINYTIGQLKSLEIEILKNRNINNRTLLNYYRYLYINNLFFNYQIKEIQINNHLSKYILKPFGFILFLKDSIFSKINKEIYKKNPANPVEILI